MEFEMNKPKTERIEEPEIIDFHNVMYWEPESKQLMARKQNGEREATTMLNKAHKFLMAGCISQKSEGIYMIKPLINYNKTTYTVIEKDGGYYCNCQGFHKNGSCSHILAVRQFIFAGNYHKLNEGVS